MESPGQIELTQPRGTTLINMGVAALIIAGLYFGREIVVPVALAVPLAAQSKLPAAFARAARRKCASRFLQSLSLHPPKGRAKTDRILPAPSAKRCSGRLGRP